jgi:hypothetical protein
MAGARNRGRKLRAIARDKLHANSPASDQTVPPRVTDSYRRGLGKYEDPSNINDKPVQGLHEVGSYSKRRKGADGDFYRPSARPLSPHVRISKTDTGFPPKVVAHERRPLPSPLEVQAPVPQKAEKLPKSKRRIQKLLTLQNNIDHLQKQLSGVWVDDRLRMDAERTLACYHATLKARLDLPAKNSAKTRYNTVRTSERIRAHMMVSKAKNKEASLEYRLKLVCEKLERDVPATVSDGQEGGMSLVRYSATDYVNLGRRRKLAKSENRLRAYVNGDELVKSIASARQTQNELERELEQTRQQSHVAEVDVNYCCFAPLDQPYICLFPTDERGRFLTGTRTERKKGGKAQVNPEQEFQKDAEAGILRTNLGNKPPLWIEIEEKMKAGLFKGLADTLGLGVDKHNLTAVGGKVDALERAMIGSSLKRRHSWMDDIEIATEDLDTESESDSDSDSEDG